MASNLEDKKRDWEQLRKESRLRNRFKEAAAIALPNSGWLSSMNSIGSAHADRSCTLAHLLT